MERDAEGIGSSHSPEKKLIEVDGTVEGSF